MKYFRAKKFMKFYITTRGCFLLLTVVAGDNSVSGICKLKPKKKPKNQKKPKPKNLIFIFKKPR